jgi:hypothetical protein
MKPRTVATKTTLSKKKGIFTIKLVLHCRKKLVKCYILSIAFYSAETCNALESRSEIPSKLSNLLLKNHGLIV